jgi:hypothetical protein
MSIDRDYTRVVRDSAAGANVQVGTFSWALDSAGRHVLNVYGDGQRVVLSNRDWRGLRNLLNALADIEASDGGEDA